GQQQRGRLVAAEPAEPLRHVHHQEAQLPGLPEQRAEQARRLGLDRVGLGKHLLAEELESGAKERPLLFAERLRRGDARPPCLLEEEAPSLRKGGGGLRVARGGHREHLGRLILESTDNRTDRLFPAPPGLTVVWPQAARRPGRSARTSGPSVRTRR